MGVREKDREVRENQRAREKERRNRRKEEEAEYPSRMSKNKHSVTEHSYSKSILDKLKINNSK